MMARSFWIVKPLINFSNIMHKHLQTTVHNISVTSTKTLRFDEIDDGLFNDYECISIDRCNKIGSIHTVIYTYVIHAKRDF